MGTLITTSIAFIGLSDVEFSEVVKLAKAHLNRGAIIVGRKSGFPRTSVDICDDAHLRDIAMFISEQGIGPARMMLLIHIASDDVDRTPLPSVAIAAIREFGISDVRVTVVPPHDEE